MALQHTHGDGWLRELATLPRGEAAGRAVTALGSAMRHNQKGEAGLAVAEARRAAALFSRLGNRAGRLRAGVEELYGLERMMNAPACLERSGVLLQELSTAGYRWAYAQALLETGICYVRAGRYGAALGFYARAQSELAASHYAQLELRRSGLAATVQIALGESSSGWMENRNGLARFWSGNYPGVRAQQFYSSYSRLAEAGRQYHLAAAAAQESVGVLARSTINRPTEASARVHLAGLLAAAGQARAAAEEYARAAGIFDALQDEAAARAYRLESEISMADSEVQAGTYHSNTLARLQRQTPESGGLAFPLLHSRYYRALGQLQLLGGSLEAAEASLRRAVPPVEARGGNRVAWQREARNVHRALYALQMAQRREPGETLTEWLAFLDPRGDAVARRRALPQTEADIFVAVQLREGVAVSLVSQGRTFTHFARMPPGETERLTAQFERQCSEPGAAGEVRRTGRQLYRLLLEPFEGSLAAGRTLAVFADTPISRIAFEALVDGGGRYLAERVRIRYGLPEAESAVDSREGGLLVEVAAPATVLPLRLLPLPGGVSIAGAMQRAFPHTRILAGRAANVEAIRGGMAKTGVFHFTGHAVSGTAGSSLVLAEEPALFTASAVRRMDLSRCRIAVLGACETGALDGDVLHPDGLVRALLDGGVRQVVASRWSVDAFATASLFSRFYAEMGNHQIPAAALEKAMAGVRSQPQTAHPYYWAGFRIYPGSPFSKIN